MEKQRLPNAPPETGKIQFIGLVLVESSTAFSGIKDDSFPKFAHQDINVNISSSNEGASFQVEMSLFLKLSYEEDRGKSGAVNFSAKYAAGYEITEKFPDRFDVKDTIQRIAALNIWPFWREFVYSMSGRMGLPPYPVPLFYPQRLKKVTQKANVSLEKKSKPSTRKKS